jgi:hypothetical protein
VGQRYGSRTTRAELELMRVLVAALIVAASTGCGRPAELGPAAAATAERPSILVVAVDAMRADRLGCYGHDRPTTPEIDRVAAEPEALREAAQIGPRDAGTIEVELDEGAIAALRRLGYLR